MKKFFLIGLFLLLNTSFFAQNDTLIVKNNYKWKIGVKGLIERSDVYFTPEPTNVKNIGLQGIYRFNNTKSSIESGFYMVNRSFNIEYIIRTTNPKEPFFEKNKITQNNLHIPIKFRIDTKIMYFTMGFYGDILLNTETTRKEIYKEVFGADRIFNMGMLAGIGLEKSIFYRYAIFVEYNYSRSLSPIRKNENFFDFFQGDNYSYLVNYGIAFGVNVKI